MRQVARTIDFDSIITDDQARRIGESEASLDALKESIRSLGLLDPLIVEDIGGDKFLLRTGRSRYKCVRRLLEEDGLENFREVPVNVIHFDPHEIVDETYKKYKVAQVIFDSNDKRTQLTRLEQARHYRELVHQFPQLFPDYSAVAKFHNKDISEVKEAMDLLSIDENVMLRIEKLNMEKSGTVPTMCIAEIAAAAADPRRPLPPEGQDRIIDMLVTPELLKDVRVLSMRDRMRNMVKDIRKEYVPETRGRKKNDLPVPEGEPTDDQAQPDLDFAQADTDEATQPVDEAVSVQATVAPAPTEDMEVSTDEPRVEPVQHTSPAPASNGKEAHAGVSPTPETQPEPRTVYNREQPDDAATPTPDVHFQPRPNTNDPAAYGIVDVSITNIIRTLQKGTLHLTDEQFRSLNGRLDQIRDLMERSVLQSV